MVPRVSAAVVVRAALLLAVTAPPAQAQSTAFAEVVRDLAHATVGNRDPGDAIARMKAALAAWDREIRDVEGRVEREVRGASRERAFQLHVELGIAYAQRGRFKEALEQFDEAAAGQPRASDVHVLRGLTLETAGRGSDAGRAFHAAWVRDSGNPIKAYLVVKRTTELDTSDRERAQKVLRDAAERLMASDSRPSGAPFLTLDPVPDTLARVPVVGDATMAGVFSRLAGGRFDEALNAPAESSAFAHFEGGRAAESEGRYADARREYAAALTGTLAGRHMLHIGIGRLAQVEGDLEAAIDAFRHAVRLSPNDPVIRRELAAAYAAADRPADAFAELVAALLIDPRNADVLAALGQLYLDTDRPADAIPPLTRALQVKRDRYETHYALALALSRVGRTDDAQREFEQFERLSNQALEQRRRTIAGELESTR